MRTLFWILLLGNVILFALMQRGGLIWGEPGYQAQPALHAEKIRLLDLSPGVPADQAQAQISKAAPEKPVVTAVVPSDPEPILPAAKTATSLPAARPEPAEKPAAPANKPLPAVSQVPVAHKQAEPVCLEWGDFSGDDLKRAMEVLSALKLGEKLGQRQIEYDKGYWVYMPPQKNKADVNRKIAQLKARGVSEYFVIWEKGVFQYAISLGVFKTKEAAENHLRKLRTQDVRTARVGERNSKLKTTMFVLNKVDALTEGKLMEAKKDFPGSELKDVPCALTR